MASKDDRFKRNLDPYFRDRKCTNENHERTVKEIKKLILKNRNTIGQSRFGVIRNEMAISQRVVVSEN